MSSEEAMIKVRMRFILKLNSTFYPFKMFLFFSFVTGCLRCCFSWCVGTTKRSFL